MAGGTAEATEIGEPMIGDPTPIVSAPDDKAIRHLSWPKIVRAGNGNLVLAYSAGVGHNKKDSP